MPIYEYQCPNCGTVEVMGRITDAPLKRCPTCRARVTKLISQSSFQLKGDGWYLTDYARKGKKDAGAAAKGDGGGEPKAEKAESPAQGAADKKPTDTTSKTTPKTDTSAA